MNGRPSDLIIIASARARPGKEAELEQALRDVAGPTRKQPGCVQFSLYRASEAGATIIGLERWASVADHQQHLKGAHVATLMGRMADILTEPPSIMSYQALDE
jgi:quinol monooxygenase YgiN